MGAEDALLDTQRWMTPSAWVRGLLDKQRSNTLIDLVPAPCLSQPKKRLKDWREFVRVWDLPSQGLCRNHLLGEHREIHAIFSVLFHGKSGYSKHPETKRWTGKLAALKIRHDAVVAEMGLRGFHHQSPLPLVRDGALQDQLITPLDEQVEWIDSKGCSCSFTCRVGMRVRVGGGDGNH